MILPFLVLTTFVSDRKRAYDFIVQTQGGYDVDNPEEETGVDKRPKLSKRIKKTSDIVSDLHCYKPLKVTTQVPALLDNRKHAKTKLKLLRISENVRKKEVDYKSPYYDIWETPKPDEKRDESDEKRDESDEKRDESDEIQELKMIQKRLVGKEPVTVPINLYQKPTLRSSVETPMPGQSYNPSQQDHQQLLRSAVEVEEAKLREEERLAKKVTSNFVKKSEIDPNAWMKEMSQGLGSEGEEEEETPDRCELNEHVPTKKPVMCKRKTKAQRGRERKNKLLQQKSKGKVAAQQISVKKVLKEWKQKEAKIEEKMKKRDERRIEKLKVGKESRVDEDIVVSLSSELKGSLRQVAPAGNLLEERFKSLQKRGIIEAHGRRTDDKKKKVRRMKKTKMFVKRNHRQVDA